MSIKRFLSLSNIAGAIFIVLTFIGLMHHEMWLDEMQHWLLARDSSSLSNLSYNMRYEGHAILWDGLLFIITRFTDNPLWMQVVNLFISALTVILILKFAHFPKLMRVLIAFGYFTFYEYADISRNYSLSVLLMVGCCILYRKRYSNYLLISVMLGLLANTHLFCVFISAAFFIALIADYFFYASLLPGQKIMGLTGILIYCACVAIAVWQIIPPPQSFVTIQSDHFLSFHRIASAFALITRAFLPIPDIKKNSWWNTNWFTDASRILCAILTLFILMASFLTLLKKPIALLIFFSSFLSIAFFIFLFQIEGVRYYGLIFISFIAALWIADYYLPSINPNTVLEYVQQLVINPFIYTVLIVQLIAGVIAYTVDFESPFSQGKNVADYLQSSGLYKHSIVVSKYNAGPPIAGYLRKQVFYSRVNQWGSYCKWNLLADTAIGYKPGSLHGLYTAKDSSIVFIADQPFFNKTLGNDSTLQVCFIKGFTGSTVLSENYFVYLITPKK